MRAAIGLALLVLTAFMLRPQGAAQLVSQSLPTIAPAPKFSRTARKSRLRIYAAR
jgi:hypothetical protein